MKKELQAFFIITKKAAVIYLLIMLMLLIPLSAMAAPSPSPTKTNASASPSPSKTNVSASPSPSNTNASTTPTPEILKSGSRGLVVLQLQLRLRELNYLNFASTSSYGQMTRQAVVDFQLTNSLTADGTVGPQTANEIFQNDAKRAPLAGNVKLNGPSASVTTAKGERISWDSAKVLLANQATVTITDFNTGSSFSMKRTGGEGCAFMEPVSNEDYSKLNTAFANGSWEKRAVIVEIDSKRYGASLSGAPYGASPGQSDMKGHVELFFDGSYSGILNLKDIDHQRMITVACSS
ncbi:MAG: peptidoglycan-binding domain-containing protein [Christensenellales bacterium]